MNPTAMKNYLSISNGGRVHRDVDEQYRFSRPLTTSSEGNMNHVRGSNTNLVSNGHIVNKSSNADLFSNGNGVNYHPSYPRLNNTAASSSFQISGSTDRLSVNSFTTTTTLPAGHNLR